VSAALSAGADLALDMGDVAEADLAFIQQIIAARGQARAGAPITQRPTHS